MLKQLINHQMIGLAPKPQELLQYIFQPWMSMHAISNQILFFQFQRNLHLQYVSQFGQL